MTRIARLIDCSVKQHGGYRPKERRSSRKEETKLPKVRVVSRLQDVAEWVFVLYTSQDFIYAVKKPEFETWNMFLGRSINEPITNCWQLQLTVSTCFTAAKSANKEFRYLNSDPMIASPWSMRELGYPIKTPLDLCGCRPQGSSLQFAPSLCQRFLIWKQCTYSFFELRSFIPRHLTTCSNKIFPLHS